MLHKDYDHRGSVAKEIPGCDLQAAWRQDEPIGGKGSVVTLTWKPVSSNRMSESVRVENLERILERVCSQTDQSVPEAAVR
jgi:hypothetical protein